MTSARTTITADTMMLLAHTAGQRKRGTAPPLIVSCRVILYTQDVISMEHLSGCRGDKDYAWMRVFGKIKILSACQAKLSIIGDLVPASKVKCHLAMLLLYPAL